jgi:hypothetical protein
MVWILNTKLKPILSTRLGGFGQVKFFYTEYTYNILFNIYHDYHDDDRRRRRFCFSSAAYPSLLLLLGKE